VLAALTVLKGLAEFVGFLLLGQGLVYVLSFGRHETNPIYQFFRFLTRPVVRTVRGMTPQVVVDRHVPMVAFMLVFWVWVITIFVMRDLLRGGSGA